MPRLEAQLKNGWDAWLIASFFLAAQHMFLPLILDGGYLLWRFGMFPPFALFTGLVIKLRPALLPYFVIVHALLNITTVLVYLTIQPRIFPKLKIGLVDQTVSFAGDYTHFYYFHIRISTSNNFRINI